METPPIPKQTRATCLPPACRQTGQAGAKVLQGPAKNALCNHCIIGTLARQNERAAAPVTEALPAFLSLQF